MSLSFTPNQMSFFALSECRYWDAYNSLRESAKVTLGTHWGTDEAVEFSHRFVMEDYEAFGGMTNEEFQLYANIHQTFITLQWLLAQLRDGMATMRMCRDARKQLVVLLSQVQL